MSVATNSLIVLAIACLIQAAPAQVPPPQPIQPATAEAPKAEKPEKAIEQEPVDPLVAYPEHDILSPFRAPMDLYAPPDELFRQLNIMRNIASRSPNKSFDAAGREVIDDPAWQQARQKVDEIGIDAGVIAGMMRLHRNEVQRATAFYGAFYCANIGYVMELISHIPGEPLRSTREAAFPRAIQFLRAHLGKRYGQLTDDEKALVIGALPELGSPAANAQGLTRLPTENDHLHSLRMTPFFQLLDVDDELDRAQALWFIKETIVARQDFANLWLEPALPRLRQLLRSDNDNVRAQSTGIFQLIGPQDMAKPPKDADELVAWAQKAGKHLFPPIRNINDAIVQLYPSAERDAIAEAGVKALVNSSIGDPFRGQKKDGSWYRGFRVGRVPDALMQLAIPKDSIITAVNGAPIGSAQELLSIITKQSKAKKPRRVMVEYVLKGQSRAIEFRIM
ncbi:MAG: hypothetical protein ACI89X_002303 [Planctomycetota bacterium]|jgi:hypothetical protein